MSHYTVDNMIDNHTLLPFYAPFLPSDRLNQIRQKLEVGKGRAISLQIGLGGDISPLRWLRFCSHCVADDRQRFEECYWHRIHQLPGIDLCPIHNMNLLNSHARMQDTRARYEFLAAEKIVSNQELSMVEPSNRYREMLLKISQEASWLLQNHDFSAVSAFSIRERYLALLADRSLATHGGKIYASKLLQASKHYYPIDLLKYLHCDLEEGKNENWLARLPRSSAGVQHPIRHILFIHFLGHTIETFLNLPSERKPFGSGPWPCLNPVCERYRERCIQTCEITYRHDIDGRPRGRFSCACGFTYSRIGPDVSDEEHFRASDAKSFGSVWEAALQKLWTDPTMSTRQIADMLGVGLSTVKLNAKRLGLPSGEPLGKTVLSQETPKRRKLEAVEVPEQSTYEEYRKKWLSIMQQNPDDGVNQLRSKVAQVYTWLYGHDSAWLKLHIPTHEKKRARRHSAISYIDWEQRDKDLALEVKTSALRINDDREQPVQVTVSAISNNMGRGPFFLRNLDKLPLTAEMLTQFAETDEAFAIRRVRWLTKCYEQEHICPTRAQFVRRGHFWQPQARWSRVKDAVDNALHILHADIE